MSVTTTPSTDVTYTFAGAGTISQDGTATASVQSAPAGTNTYTVTVTNTLGCNTTSSAQITITSLPLASWEVDEVSGYGTSPFSATNKADGLATASLSRGSGVTTSGTAASNAWGGQWF